MHARIQRLAHQQLEGAFGRLQLVALVFHLLDPLQQFAARILAQPVGQPVLLQLVENVAAAGKIAHQHALPVAHRCRRDVLVSGRILQHRGNVHAAFVRKRALTHVRLIARQRQVSQFSNELARRSQVGQPLRPDRGMAQLQLQVGDDGRQIGVAASLPVAVETPLHVRRAGLDSRHAVGHRAIRIVMGVDADHAVEALADLRHDLHQPPGKRAAIGIAQAEHLSASFLCRFERAQRVVRVGTVTVEEVFGVIDHFLAVLVKVRDRLGNQLEIFVERNPQRAFHVQVPRLTENRRHRSAGFHQRPHVAILRHAVLGETGRAKRRQPGVFQMQIARALEELLVFRVRSRPAAFDVIDAQLVQFLCDDQLVVHRKGNRFPLRPIAQRGVERKDLHIPPAKAQTAPRSREKNMATDEHR